jgi:hypothetical protein
MKRLVAAVLLSFGLVASSPTSGHATGPPSEPHETERGNTLRAVYFPFLAIGHGVLAILTYGVAYPIYYLAKPAYDFLYESSEDPAELERSPSSGSQAGSSSSSAGPVMWRSGLSRSRSVSG